MMRTPLQPTAATDARYRGGLPQLAGGLFVTINCAHPTHFEDVLTPGAEWLDRIRGLRANSSRMSHVELDEAPELDEGDPIELGHQYRALRDRLPALSVLGGCCGTDHRHVAEIAAAWSA